MATQVEGEAATIRVEVAATRGVAAAIRAAVTPAAVWGAAWGEVVEWECQGEAEWDAAVAVAVKATA